MLNTVVRENLSEDIKFDLGNKNQDESAILRWKNVAGQCKRKEDKIGKTLVVPEDLE